MCELLGICMKHDIRVNELLDAFYHHSDIHKDGWGLAVFRGAGVSIEKEGVRATESSYLRQRLSREISASNLFAHIRLATIGRIEYANCHPFVWDDDSGRTWTLIHNGTMFEGEPLRPFLSMQEGTTDSERILLYIISRMNAFAAKAGQIPDREARFAMLDEITLQLAAGNKLNMMLYDGEYMYIHTNCADTLHQKKTKEGYIFATSPVIYDGFEPVPMNQLQVYRSGRPVFTGTKHTHTFHEEDYDMTPLFAAYSEL